MKMISLDDKPFVQEIDGTVNIFHYAINLNLENVVKVRFTIKDVYDGPGDVTGLSELLFYTHPFTGY